MASSSDKNRFGKVIAKFLELGGVVQPKVAGGTASITGTGTVTVPGFATITSVVVSLNQDVSLFGDRVSATASGNVITIKVWKPTSSTDTTPIAASAAKSVSYVVTGS